MTVAKEIILALATGIALGFGFALMLFSALTIPTKHPVASNSNFYFIDRVANNNSVRVEKRVRVLCWVMTSPENHQTRALAVKETWGKRCDQLLFMSTQNDTELGAVSLANVEEGREWLWAKTKYVWENHRDEADWFLKADDDAYVIVENLRSMLRHHDPVDPIYFGCRYTPSKELDYMAGGPGYVLSKEALRRFIEIALSDTIKCSPDHDGAEDAEMGKCLSSVGVISGDSRDDLGRHRFLPFDPESQLFEPVNGTMWFWEYMHYAPGLGTDCCSESAISFHYVSPRLMKIFEYLIYRLKRHNGISYKGKGDDDEPSFSSTTTTTHKTKHQNVSSTSFVKLLTTTISRNYATEETSTALGNISIAYTNK